jgi:hypothetical protein
MRKIALLFAVLFVVATVAPASAGNVCVENIFGQLFRFDNVPLLGKGKTFSLRGEFHYLGTDVNLPFEGVVTLASDGVTTRIGIITFPGPVTSPVMWSMVGDKKFNATGTWDNAPFGSIDGNDTWTNVSCAAPFPPASAPMPLGQGTPGFSE